MLTPHLAHLEVRLVGVVPAKQTDVLDDLVSAADGRDVVLGGHWVMVAVFPPAVA